MYCINCGKEINEDVTFCKYCGVSQIIEINETEEKGDEHIPASENVQESIPFNKNAVWITLALVLIAIIGIVILYKHNDDRSYSDVDNSMSALDENFTSDFEENEKKTIAMIERVSVQGKWAYFFDETGKKIVKRNVEGEEYDVISNINKAPGDRGNGYEKLCLVGDWIYYPDREGIIRIRTDGNNKTVIDDEGRYNGNFAVCTDHVIYIQGYNGTASTINSKVIVKNTISGEVEFDSGDLGGDNLKKKIIGVNGNKVFVRSDNEVLCIDINESDKDIKLQRLITLPDNIDDQSVIVDKDRLIYMWRTSVYDDFFGDGETHIYITDTNNGKLIKEAGIKSSEDYYLIDAPNDILTGDQIILLHEQYDEARSKDSMRSYYNYYVEYVPLGEVNGKGYRYKKITEEKEFIDNVYVMREYVFYTSNEHLVRVRYDGSDYRLLK